MPDNPQEKDLNNPKTWKESGNEFFNKGLYEEAIKCYAHAIELDPNFAEAWNNLGLSLLKLGKIEEAKKCNEKVKELKEKVQSQKKTIQTTPTLQTTKETIDKEYCQNCGSELPYKQGEWPASLPKICPSCGVRVKDPIRYGSREGQGRTHAAQLKNPILAALLSMIPGLGQAYNGQLGKAFLFLIGVIIGSILIIPGVIIWIYGIYHAYKTAKQMNYGDIPFKNTNIVLIIFFGIIGVVFILIIFALVAVIIGAFTYGVVGSSPSAKIVGVTATTEGLTWQGGNDLSKVISWTAKLNDETIIASGSSAPKVGQIDRFSRSIDGERVIVVATFSDGYSEVLLDKTFPGTIPIVTTPVSANLKTYKNQKYSYTIKYPQDWTIQEKPTEIDRYSWDTPKPEKDTTLIVSPQFNGKKSTFEINAYRYYDLGPLEEYFLSIVPQSGVDITKRHAQIKIGDLPAYRIDYNTIDREGRISEKQIVIVAYNDDDRYKIRYFGEPGAWDQYLGTAEDMIQSFSFNYYQVIPDVTLTQTTMKTPTPTSKLLQDFLKVTHASVSSIRKNWDADPEDDGITIHPSLRDDKDSTVYWSGATLPVDIEIWSTKYGDDFIEVKDKLVYSGSGTIDNWEDGNMFMGGGIRIPFESMNVPVGENYGWTYATIHTPDGKTYSALDKFTALKP